MSKFVNYKKRGVKLPTGCSALFDVLRPRIEVRTINGTPQNEEAVGTFKDIKSFMERLFGSQALSAQLLIGPSDGRILFDICSSRFGADGSVHGVVQVPEGGEEEVVVRRFLTQPELGVPRSSEASTGLLRKAPVTILCRVQPFPSEPATAAQLGVDLFRDVCGLNATSELRFQFHEIVRRGKP